MHSDCLLKQYFQTKSGSLRAELLLKPKSQSLFQFGLSDACFFFLCEFIAILTSSVELIPGLLEIYPVPNNNNTIPKICSEKILVQVNDKSKKLAGILT